MTIYKQYDQAALNYQYNNRLLVPEWADHLERWPQWSRETEKKFKAIKNVAYGSHTRERLDIYPSSKPGSKILIFIHGGYWQRLDKSDFHFVAGAFMPYDITTILINYPLAPHASMNDIISSCRNAFLWVYKNIHEYGADPTQLHLAGHSAGGHLAAMLLTEKIDEIPATALKGACAVSGLFNLIPIQLSEVNDVLQLNGDMAIQNSPVHLSPKYKCPLVIAVGEEESREFKSQSEELFLSWKKKNIPLEFIQAKNLNHYSIIESFADRSSFLHNTVKHLMKI